MTETSTLAETPELVHVGQHSIYLSTDPQDQLNEARARAKVLVEVVREQGLAKTFGNSSKPHVFVEGWQFLASQFGLIPEIEWTRELDTGAGWEARAALRRLSDGQIISTAEAECRTTERNWKNRDSYAVRSMAQTRAVSKVCRIALSSVMVMAGFNATPAEEMDGVYDSTPTDSPVAPDEPHCPACLDEYGTLVGVWQNDKKPFWKCKAKEDCAAWDGSYAWSGWRSDWENSVAEYRDGIIKDDPREVTIDPMERTARSDYIVRNVMELAGLTNTTDAKVWVKPGLIVAISEGSVDAAAALGGELGEEPTDEELRVVIGNLTVAEADAVAAMAVEAKMEAERPFE